MKGQWKSLYRPPTVHKSSDKQTGARVGDLRQLRLMVGKGMGGFDSFGFENVGMFAQNPWYNLVSSSNIHKAKDCLPVCNLRRVCHCWVDNWGLSPCCWNGSHHSWKYSCRCSNSRARLWTTGHYVFIHNQNTVSVFWNKGWSLPESSDE